MKAKNLFTQIPSDLPDELIETLAQSGNIKIERIISRGHSSDEGFWYDQDRDEFVVLLKGSAGLLFEGDRKAVRLSPGDYLNIRAHVKHRVEWTAADQDTVWLAVFY